MPSPKKGSGPLARRQVPPASPPPTKYQLQRMGSPCIRGEHLDCLRECHLELFQQRCTCPCHQLPEWLAARPARARLQGATREFYPRRKEEYERLKTVLEEAVRSAPRPQPLDTDSTQVGPDCTIGWHLTCPERDDGPCACGCHALPQRRK